MKCKDIWGGDCEAELEKSRTYICVYPVHCLGPNSDILKVALRRGFAADQVAELSQGHGGSAVSKDLVKFIAALPRGRDLVASSNYTPRELIDEIDAPTVAVKLSSEPLEGTDTAFDALKNLECCVDRDLSQSWPKIPSVKDSVHRIRSSHELGAGNDWRKRVRLASSTDLSQEQLDLLARDENPTVRGAVAINPSTSQELLEHLVLDPDFIVRFRLAQTWSLPIHLVIALMGDPVQSVRRILSTNSHTPYFFDTAAMASALESFGPFAWTILLSRNRVPDGIRNQILRLDITQEKVLLSEFGLCERSNIEFLARCVARNLIECEDRAKYTILARLCQNRSDKATIEEFTEHMLGNQMRIPERFLGSRIANHANLSLGTAMTRTLRAQNA